MAPNSRPLIHPALGGGGLSGGGGGGGGLSGLTSGVVGAQSSGGLVGPMGSPFGVVGVEPSTVSKYKGEFKSMTALAAAASAVGDLAYLVGIDTRAPIMLCQRIQTGDNGIAWHGAPDLYQANGPEFDGAFAWVALGASPAPTWGTPGDITTGGLIPGAGAYVLPGFQRFAGKRRSVWCRWRLVSLPGVPATGQQLQGGLLPSASTTTDAYLGGWGYNTSTYRGVGSVNGNPQSPTLAYSGTGVTLTAGDYIETHLDLFKTSATSGAAAYSLGGSQANNSSGAVQSGATSGLDSDVDSFQLLITQSGGWVARLVQFAVLPVYG